LPKPVANGGGKSLSFRIPYELNPPGDVVFIKLKRRKNYARYKNQDNDENDAGTTPL
jgi:hypothetical protein